MTRRRLTALLNGWTLRYAYTGDQHLGQGWSGTWSQSGKDITVTRTSPWRWRRAAGSSTPDRLP